MAGYISSSFRDPTRHDDMLSMSAGQLAWGPEASRFQACRSAAPGALSDLVPMQRWRSLKKLPGGGESISIVTHVSMDRLHSLQMQCEGWGDRLAAVVYVPLVAGFGAVSARVGSANGTSTAQIADALSWLHSTMEGRREGCALDLELVAEELSSLEDPRLGAYPANALRNRAMMLADRRSELVLTLEADFLPEGALPRTYQGRPRTFARMAASLIDSHRVMALPEFAPVLPQHHGDARDARDVREKVLEAAAGGKDHVLSAWRLGLLRDMHPSEDMDYWRTAKKPFEVEPGAHLHDGAIVAPRALLPFYDERFRGAADGLDAALHAAHMYQGLGVRLAVHHRSFAVQSISGAAAAARAEGDKVPSRTERMYEAALEEIGRGEYVPVTSFAEFCPRTVAAAAEVADVAEDATLPPEPKAQESKDTKGGKKGKRSSPRKKGS